MLQNIREDVTRTVARIDFQFQEPEPMPLPELPDFLTTHIDPFTGEDNSADIDGGALGVIADTLPPMPVPQDRKSVVLGKRGSGRVTLGGRRIMKKKTILIRTNDKIR